MIDYVKELQAENRKKGQGGVMENIQVDWSEWQHIYPLNDLIEHETNLIVTEQDETYPCPCRPKLDFDYKLIIHAVMDRREVFEKDGK